MSIWRALNSRPKLVTAAAVLGATLYVALHLGNGWIAHDEGQLGQTAERTMLGEIPHRDFDDMYTGALTFLHAGAFRWFGVDSLSLRWMLLLWFVPTIAAFHYLASRVAPPLVAAAVTLLGAMLSLPVYSAPMPSWYNLFLAIGGTAALIRIVETDHRRWLFAAGLCGGLSILFKITGLYFVGSALLFLVYREQLLSRSETDSAPAPSVGWFSWLTTLALLAFAGLGLAFVRSGSPAMNVIHFALPLAALAGYLIAHELKTPRGPSAARLRRMAAMAVPFGLGCALPVAGFAAYYAAGGALRELYEGVFVLPAMRTENGAFPLPDLAGLAASAPLAALLAYGLRPGNGSRRRAEYIVLIVLAVLLAFSGTEWGFFLGLHGVRNSVPWVVAIGMGMMVRSEALNLSVDQKQCLYVMCSTAMLCSLVQYPHAYGIYFFYAAPLVVLAGLYISAYQPWPLKKALVGVLAFYLAFAALRLNGPDPHANVAWLGGRRASEPSGLERCTLTVAAEEAAAYRDLVAAIQVHSSPGEFIFAAPDCPEVYFLAARKNPSRVMYEFFRPDWLSDHQSLMTLLDEKGVNVVVLNGYPGFSKRLDPTLVKSLEQRYDHMHAVMMTVGFEGRQIERFRVYWRE